MINTDIQSTTSLKPLLQKLQNQREYFQSGATLSYAFRIAQLKKLKVAILQYEDVLYKALYDDLKKNKEETWITELGFVIAEIDAAVKQLKTWMQPKKVSTNLLNLPSSSYLYKEPLGVVLIISPWNYPFQLLINPLVGAIAAGNACVLKSSEFAPATSTIMKKMIEEIFEENYVLFVEGDGAVVVPDMMNNFTFNHVFYTGSTGVGKIIYEMAAKRLVPVTLELGGKSPCIVEADANIQVAARRIAIAKFSNAGQMCVAPDYILVHTSVKEALVAELKKSIISFFGEDAANSNEYCKIINERQFNRIISYLQQGNIVFGGTYNKETLFITPTIIDAVLPDAPIMREEIFGPVLPIITYNTQQEARQIIALNPNPLAFYVFTQSNSNAELWLNTVPFGGGCVNNCSWHLTNHHLPFGGRGFSGTGMYHGKYSFNTFSHQKAVMKTPTWFDPNIKYPPLTGKLNLYKKVI